MDSPPVPKPRTIPYNEESNKTPVPLPRTKLPNTNNTEKVVNSDLFQRISSASKQLGEDLASKVQISAKTANEKIEKSISGSTRRAKETFEKTLSASKVVQSSVTKSLIEGTKNANSWLRRNRNSTTSIDESDAQRCASMPVQDIKLFENIQFHSPLIDTKKYKHQDDLSNMNANTISDNASISSNNSICYVDTSSIVSSTSQENGSIFLDIDNSNLDIYDTPKTASSNTVPDIKNDSMSNVLIRKKQNPAYDNWSISGESEIFQPSDHIRSTANKSTIFEFDPLNTSSSNFEGISNELLLLQSFLVGDMYGTITSRNSMEDCGEYSGDLQFFDLPTPPERSDSLQQEDNSISEEVGNTTWFTDSEKNEKTDTESSKPNLSYKKKVSNILKLDVLSKSDKLNLKNLQIVERPRVGLVPTIFYKGFLSRPVSGVTGEFLMKNAQLRYCILNDQKLSCFGDSNHTILKEEYSFESICSLQMVLPLLSR